MKNAIAAIAICALLGCSAAQAQALVDELIWPQGLFSRAADVGYARMPGSLSHHPGLNGTLYPFKDGAVNERHDSTLDYVTPAWHGVTVGATYRYGEAASSNLVNRSYGATLGYERGPLTLTMMRQRKSNLLESVGLVAAIDNSTRDTMVAANVNVGAVSAYAAFGLHKGGSMASWNDSIPYGALLLSLPSTDSRDAVLGLAVRYGSTVLMISHSRRDDRSGTNLDSNRFALGITHRWSKESELYAAYAKIRSTSVSGLGPGSGGAFNIGLRFGF
jgi:predicted porin